MSNEMNDGSTSIERVEQLIEAGHTKLAPALRHMYALRECIRDFSDADPIVGIAFNAIDRILAGFDPNAATPVAGDGAPSTFDERARALCADLLEISIDGNLHQYAQLLRGLQLEARSLLTGESYEYLKTTDD